MRLRVGSAGEENEERYLAARERLVTSVRHHPAMLGRVVAETLLMIAIAVAVEIAVRGAGGLSDVGWLAMVVAAARLAVLVYDWYDVRVMITDRRIIRVSGFVVRRVATMPLGKVTDLTYRRTWTGRLMGFGSFIVESAGQEHGLREIHYLPNPDTLYLAICEMMFGDPASGKA
jgi:Bacterial PH domain